MGQSSGRLSSGRSISVISGPPAVILHAAVVGASIQFVSASQKHEPVFVIAVRAASAYPAHHPAAAQSAPQPPPAAAATAAVLSAPSHSSALPNGGTGQSSGGGSLPPPSSVVSPLPSSSSALLASLTISAATAALATSSLAGTSTPPSAPASLMSPLTLSLPSPSAAVTSFLSSSSSSPASSPSAVSELTFELVRRYTAFDRLYHSLRALQPVHQQHVSHVPAHPDPNGPTFLADMSAMLSQWMANLLNNPTLARQTVTILFFTQQEFNTLPPHSQLQLADKHREESLMADDSESEEEEEDGDEEDEEEDGRRQTARHEAGVAETADELMADADDAPHSGLHGHTRGHTDGHSHLLDDDGAGEGADVVADISLAQMRGEMGSPTLAPLYERTPSISSSQQYGQADEQRHDDHTTTQRSHSHSHSSARTHTAHHASWHTHDAAAAAAAQHNYQQHWQHSNQAHTGPHHGHLHQLHTASHHSHHAHLTSRADAGWTPPTLQLSHNVSPPALGLHGTLPASSPRSTSSSSSSASPTMYLPPPALRASYEQQQQQQQHTPQLSPAGQPHHHHHHHSLYSPPPPSAANAASSDGSVDMAGVPLSSPPSSTSSSSQSSQSPAVLARGLSSPAAGRFFMSIAPSRSSFSFSPSHSRRSLSYNNTNNTSATATSPHASGPQHSHQLPQQHEPGGSSQQPPQPPHPPSRHSSSCSPSSRSGAVRLRDFHLLKVIGKGSFGKVLLVRKRDTDAVYAMKVLHKANVIKRNQVEHTMTERSVLEYIRHPFIVALRYAFQTKHKLYFVLDYMPGGELFFHLGKAGRFTESRAKFYAAQIILALEHLHAHSVIYRDLKPENVLLDADGNVLLTDFGLSKEGVSDNISAHSFCGTPEYLAPEILTRQGHGRAADWWSLGAILYEMVVGMPPFYSRQRDRLFQKILSSSLRMPRSLSDECRHLLMCLLDRNPNTRIGSRHDAMELKLHPFFADIDWSLLAEKKLAPPFKPNVQRVTDTDNFDVEFTSMPLHSHEANKSHTAKQQPQHASSHTDGAHLAGGSGGSELGAVEGAAGGVDAVVVPAGEEDEEDEDDGADGEAADSAGQFANFTFVSHDYL